MNGSKPKEEENKKDEFQKFLRLKKKYEPEEVDFIPLTFKTSEVKFDAIVVQRVEDGTRPIWGGKFYIASSTEFSITSVNVLNNLKLIAYCKENGGEYKRCYSEIRDVKITIDRKMRIVISGKSTGGYFEFVYKDVTSS